MLLLLDAILEQYLHHMMPETYAHFVKEETTDAHKRMRQRAYRTNIRYKEKIEEFINRQLQIRKYMVSAKYSSIGNEAVTISFIIRGIEPRSNLAQYIWLLRLQL